MCASARELMWCKCTTWIHHDKFYTHFQLNAWKKITNQKFMHKTIINPFGRVRMKSDFMISTNWTSFWIVFLILGACIICFRAFFCSTSFLLASMLSRVPVSALIATKKSHISRKSEPQEYQEVTCRKWFRCTISEGILMQAIGCTHTE